MSECSGQSTEDENEVLEPYTQLQVPFASRSDMLLAQLRLHDGLSRSHFNLVLDVLRHPSFSVEDISLQNAADIDSRVSKHREHLARRRCGASPAREPGLQPNKGLTSSLVFGLVLDFMLSEIEHFSYEADTAPNCKGAQPNSSESQRDARKWSLRTDMKNMSLVHRTWMLPAQRALSRRVVLTTKRHLRAFALSPACGSGVRELAYKIDKTDACTFFHDGSAALEHWGVLASVLSRLPNLRLLCLRVESAHLPDLNGLHLVLQAVGSLSSLEGLWLLAIRDHCPYLPDVCAVLPKLANLRLLSVYNWTCPFRGADRFIRDVPLPQGPPPARLKTLQFRDSYLSIPSSYLSWLFAPRDEYSLATLDLQITFPSPTRPNTGDPREHTSHASPAHFLIALKPLLPSLERLALRFFYHDAGTPNAATAVLAAHDADTQALLAHATSLRRVRLHRLRNTNAGAGAEPLPGSGQGAARAMSSVGALALPDSLEELHMHYTYTAVNWRTQDRRLASTLAAAAARGGCRSLRRVIVTAGEVDMPARACAVSEAVTGIVQMPKAREVCAALGIEFVPKDGVYLNQYAVDGLP